MIEDDPSIAMGLRMNLEGEGYVAFTHAFLLAGARSLLVSSWPIHDVATGLLVSRFYQILATASATNRADALRQAKLWLATRAATEGEASHAHPCVWGAMTLYGALG